MKSIHIWIPLCVFSALLAYFFGYELRGTTDAVDSSIVDVSLGQTLLALDNYHYEHGAFPDAYGSEHTWRLSLFEEYLEEGYEGYNRSLPWDAPENLEWSRQIGGCPPVFLPHPDDSNVACLFICTDLTKWRWRDGVRTRMYTNGDDFVFVIFDPNSTTHWLNPDLPKWPI